MLLPLKGGAHGALTGAPRGALTVLTPCCACACAYTSVLARCQEAS